MRCAQRIAFGMAVVLGLGICVALFRGGFSPEVETFVAAPESVAVSLPPSEVVVEVETRRIVSPGFEGSDLERVESRVTGHSLHLLDTTSPLPVIRIDE